MVYLRIVFIYTYYITEIPNNLIILMNKNYKSYADISDNRNAISYRYLNVEM